MNAQRSWSRSRAATVVAWWPVPAGSRSCGRREGSTSRSTRRRGSSSCWPAPSSSAWPLALDAGRGGVPGAVRHRRVRGQRRAAQPVRPRRHQRGHRHLDPDGRGAHRPDRGGDRHPGQLPQADAGPAMTPSRSPAPTSTSGPRRLLPRPPRRRRRREPEDPGNRADRRVRLMRWRV
jgi:hypothetical protein